jgi:L-iditol 2-dehydrogenase
MDETMRAGVYRGVGDIRIERVPLPQVGYGEALVRIDSCGVCGTDLKKIQYGLVEPPRVFGHEMAGTIARTGPKVRNWREGDRVAVMHHVPCMACFFCSQKCYSQCPKYKETGTTAAFEPAGGGFAEYIRVMDWIVKCGMVRVPDDVSLEEATFVEPVNTCLKALAKACVRPGQSAVVFGLGQIGLIFIQLLRLKCVSVFGSDPIYRRRKTAIGFGALEAFDPSFAQLSGEIQARTGGRGADIAIVAVAQSQLIPSAMASIRPGGKVILFAQTRLDDLTSVDAGAICMLEKDLMGSYSSDIDLQDEAARLIFTRKIDVGSLITHRLPLDKIRMAIRLASNPSSNSLKVIIKP